MKNLDVSSLTDDEQPDLHDDHDELPSTIIDHWQPDEGDDVQSPRCSLRWEWEPVEAEDDGAGNVRSRQRDKPRTRAEREASADEEVRLVIDNLGLVFAVMADMHVSDRRSQEVELDFGIGQKLRAGPCREAGILGLIQAVKHHDRSKGKLSTYAWRRIEGSIRDHLRQAGAAHREPAGLPDVADATDPVPESVAELLREFGGELDAVKADLREQTFATALLHLSDRLRGKHHDVATDVVAWRLGLDAEATRERLADFPALDECRARAALRGITNAQQSVLVEGPKLSRSSITRLTSLTPDEVRGLEARAMRLLRAELTRRCASLPDRSHPEPNPRTRTVLDIVRANAKLNDRRK